MCVYIYIYTQLYTIPNTDARAILYNFRFEQLQSYRHPKTSIFNYPRVDIVRLRKVTGGKHDNMYIHTYITCIRVCLTVARRCGKIFSPEYSHFEICFYRFDATTYYCFETILFFSPKFCGHMRCIYIFIMYTYFNFNYNRLFFFFLHT